MRIFVLCLLFMVWSWSGHSQTRVMFDKDGDKATVFMLATHSNPDAKAFNSILKIPAEDASGKTVKKLEFLDARGNNPLDVACAFSKVVPDTGSCFLTFHNVEGVLLSPSERKILFHVMGEDAVRLASAFQLPASGSEVFVSSDKLLQIHLESDQSHRGLTISYGAD